MIDILQVLEGAAYVGFIAGAVFAVVELRSLAKDRRTELLLRSSERWASKENEEAMIKLRESRATDPRAIEMECTKAALWMVVDYLDGIADLAQDKLLDEKSVLELVAWDLFLGQTGALDQGHAKHPPEPVHRKWH